MKVFNYLGSLLLGCCLVPVYYFCNNYPQFSIQSVLHVIFAFVGIFLLLSLITKSLLKNNDHVIFLMYGTSIVFWFLLPISCYLRHNIIFFRNLNVREYRYTLVFLGSLISVLIICFFIKYLKKFIVKINHILSVFVFLLTGLFCIQIIQNISVFDKNASTKTNNTVLYPNVYHILLDGHPNLKGMEIIGGNLDPFYQKLESIGFITFPKSKSNYPATPWAVASMLNMDYLNIGTDLPVEFYWKLSRNNKVFDELSKYYSISVKISSDNLRSMYPANRIVVTDDNQCTSWLLTYTILNNTPLQPILGMIFHKKFLQVYKKCIDNTLKFLANAKSQYGASNHFFYSHFLCPNGPSIYSKIKQADALNSIFSKKDDSNLLDPIYHKIACENIHGIDTDIIKTIKDILSQYNDEKIKPIIILHSDHSILYRAFKFNSPYITDDTIYGNLLALYVPEEWKEDAKDLKFINLYRFILNHLFNENHEYFKENKQIRTKD